MNNWTIWCTQNVLLSLFLTGLGDKRQRTEILRKSCQSTDYFLAEYGDDGCCDEGAQYYRHAGLCLFQVTEILNEITDGCFSSLYENNKIRNIASYIWNVHIDGKYYANFADCSPVAGRAGTREFLFARRTENENMMRFAAQDFHAGGLDGDNADSHNHNDTGSFTVYKQGQPLLIDVGVESYTKKTFSPQRYEIWTMQSAYHNLPTVNGLMQQDGENYCAAEVSCHMSDTLCELTMDISGAYPKEAGLSRYLRRAALLKNKEIMIHDRFAFAAAKAGESGSPSVILTEIQEIPVTDPRLQTAWKHNLYRILLRLTGTETILHIH